MTAELQYNIETELLEMHRCICVKLRVVVQFHFCISVGVTIQLFPIKARFYQ